MSDTPRTDALHYRTCAFGDGYRMSVLTDMCRELERELAAVTAERDALRDDRARAERELAAATVERDALNRKLQQVTAMHDAISCDVARLTAERDHLRDATKMIKAENAALRELLAYLAKRPTSIHHAPFPGSVKYWLESNTRRSSWVQSGAYDTPEEAIQAAIEADKCKCRGNQVCDICQNITGDEIDNTADAAKGGAQ